MMMNLNNFLFAMIAINLTFLSKIYFNLIDDDTNNTLKSTNKIKDCTRAEFKTFCEVLTIDSLVINIDLY